MLTTYIAGVNNLELSAIAIARKTSKILALMRKVEQIKKLISLLSDGDEQLKIFFKRTKTEVSTIENLQQQLDVHQQELKQLEIEVPGIFVRAKSLFMAVNR